MKLPMTNGLTHRSMIKRFPIIFRLFNFSTFRPSDNFKHMKHILPGKCILLALILLVSGCGSGDSNSSGSRKSEERPAIVNIINFIRQNEPRIEWITEDVLYQTVVEQIKMMKEFDLKGTFLLQYDALIDPRYQELMKGLPNDQFEIGVWWEIPQPLVENSGYEWRGRYSWDWHADVGFATGYSPEERVKLIDTYMADFKEIFGYYPKSVASWFIDAHTLKYLVEEYGIVASANCKDQVGTDGYTLWGGYWNQAYYPSVNNAYMPAQNRENQINVPVFRMLGSDPIHQYDEGLGTDRQHVISLEPVWSPGGKDSLWVDWYFKEFVEGPSMEFAYVQTGQENSFTWNRMKRGFELQMPLIARLRDEGILRVEKLEETGRWFADKYEVTPATSVTALSDHSEKDLRTVWFNSRYYRANFLWENGTMRFRDIHLFDERIKSDYLTQQGTSSRVEYYTLPVVDGFHWSSDKFVAGIRIKTAAELINGQPKELIGGEPVVDDSSDGLLSIIWPLSHSDAVLHAALDEESILLEMQKGKRMDWFLEISYDEEKEIPIVGVEKKKINYSFRGFDYSITLKTGQFKRESESVIRVIPQRQKIEFDLMR
jgi:hypothetical protein